MNLLHFTCKFGAKKFRCEQEALHVLTALIERGMLQCLLTIEIHGKAFSGINLSAPCLWIRMNCLHYCAFFDSPLLCELLLKQSKVQSCRMSSPAMILSSCNCFSISKNLVLNQPCSSFQKQTALHLACSAFSLSTAEILLRHGAKKEMIDDQQRLPSGSSLVSRHAYDRTRSIQIAFHWQRMTNSNVQPMPYEPFFLARNLANTSSNHR